VEEPLQDETTFEQGELSPAEQLQLQWRQQPGFIPFIRQKNVIDQNAELLPYAGVVKLPGWASPRAFAFQGLVLLASILSLANWYFTKDRGKLKDEILSVQASVKAEEKRQQGIMDAARAERKKILASPRLIVWKNVSREEALQAIETTLGEGPKSLQEYKQRMGVREADLRSQLQAEAIANSGTPLVFSLALMLSAGLIAGGVRRDFPRSVVRGAGDFYLYLATAYGLWPTLLLVVGLHYALSGGAWGLHRIPDTAGPLFWIVFWIGFWILLLYYFGIVSRYLYRALQIRPPANEWTLENRLLARLTLSFLVVFVVMEAGFLSACYLLYVGMRAWV
jgi:hypothetical protein